MMRPHPQPGRVTVVALRPGRSTGRRCRQTFDFPFEPGMSALDVALYVQRYADGTFTFSYCCRNSHCGLCGASW